jgi:hypothetical protein
MNEYNITDRCFKFAVRIVKQDRVSRTLANQLLRSGTLIGANVGDAPRMWAVERYFQKREGVL